MSNDKQSEAIPAPPGFTGPQPQVFYVGVLGAQIPQVGTRQDLIQAQVNACKGHAEMWAVLAHNLQGALSVFCDGAKSGVCELLYWQGGN